MKHIAAAALFFFLTPLAAQKRDTSAVDRAVDQIFAVRAFGQAAISPDGTRTAWVEPVHKADGTPTANNRIFVRSLRDESAPIRVTAGTAGADLVESKVAWSPDGASLAFVSGAEGKQAQLYVAAPGQAASKLTDLRGYVSEPRWSPDGKQIAFLFVENATRAAGALAAMTPDAGVVAESFEEERIAVLDVASKKVSLVTPPDMYVYDFDWSPDGTRFVAEAVKGSGENNYWVAQLFTVPSAGGTMTPLYSPRLQVATPRWSPDGSTIAFIEGLMSDEGLNGGDIFVIPANGGEARNLTPGMRASASSLFWRDAKNIDSLGNTVGRAAVLEAHLDGSAPKIVWSESCSVTAGSRMVTTSRDGSIALVRDAITKPSEVWAGPIGAMKQITHRNDGVVPLWSEEKSIEWKSDEFDVQGFLVFPKNYDSSKKYPMVVYVHGGPAGAVTSGWPSVNNAPLMASGYVLFLPNFRGSFGNGERFKQANVKDFGYGDLRDIQRGVDEAMKHASIDRDRIGVWGWSYGGYMTMWTVTQTQRFKAAVAGAGISNWQSYYGQNSIDQWMIPYFGASVYDDPYIYARSSPITFIKQVKTPTLILVGDRDGEVPSPQSYEFFHALKTIGVPTQMVVYPNEGHRFSDLQHRRDVARRIVGWFDSYLK